MQKLDFLDAVDLIVSEDPRFDREAYVFLRDALDYTVKLQKKSREEHENQHVTGQQILDGVRQYALKQFGPMSVTVLNYWNIHRCEDFGTMVYALIRAGTFSKTSTDSEEDFRSLYTFEDAFVRPFLPDRPAGAVRQRAPLSS